MQNVLILLEALTAAAGLAMKEVDSTAMILMSALPVHMTVT
jgi:hypothetical protein